MISYSCPALNPSLMSLSSSHLFWCCVSLSLPPSACYSWHIVLFPRWWLIWGTSHSIPHIWSPFRWAERLLILPLSLSLSLFGWLGRSQSPDQIPVEGASLSPGNPAPGGSDTQTRRLTNSHLFHGRYGLYALYRINPTWPAATV